MVEEEKAAPVPILSNSEVADHVASLQELTSATTTKKPSAVRFQLSSAIKSVTPFFMKTPFKTTDALTQVKRSTGLTPIIEELEGLRLLSSCKKVKDDSDAKVPRRSLLEEIKQ